MNSTKAKTAPNQGEKKNKILTYIIGALHISGGLSILSVMLLPMFAFFTDSFLTKKELPILVLLSLLLVLLLYAVIIAFSCAAIYDGFSIIIRKKTSGLTKFLLFAQIPVLYTNLIEYQLHFGLSLSISNNFSSMIDLRFFFNYGGGMELGFDGSALGFIMGINIVPIIILTLMKRFTHRSENIS